MTETEFKSMLRGRVKKVTRKGRKKMETDAGRNRQICWENQEGGKGKERGTKRRGKLN